MPAGAGTARRRHRPAAERMRLEALELLAAAAFQYRARLELTPSPLPCHTAREWAEYSEGRPIDPARACSDCTAAFQAQQQRLGLCRPPAGARTPAVRLQAREYGADEPIRMRRAHDDARPAHEAAARLGDGEQRGAVPVRHLRRAPHEDRQRRIASGAPAR